MPNTTAKRLIDGTTLTNAPVALYVAPANTKAVVKQMSVVNRDTVARTVSIWMGSTQDDAHLIWDAHPVPPTATGQASDTSVFEAFNQVIESGQTIWADADIAAKVSLNASGYELN